MEAGDEQQTVSVQVEEKGVFCLSFLKTFYQFICHRQKGKSAFRVGQHSNQDLAPLISDICHPLALPHLDSFKLAYSVFDGVYCEYCAKYSHG